MGGSGGPDPGPSNGANNGTNSPSGSAGQDKEATHNDNNSENMEVNRATIGNILGSLRSLHERLDAVFATAQNQPAEIIRQLGQGPNNPDAPNGQIMTYNAPWIIQFYGPANVLRHGGDDSGTDGSDEDAAKQKQAAERIPKCDDNGQLRWEDATTPGAGANQRPQQPPGTSQHRKDNSLPVDRPAQQGNDRQVDQGEQDMSKAKQNIQAQGATTATLKPQRPSGSALPGAQASSGANGRLQFRTWPSDSLEGYMINAHAAVPAGADGIPTIDRNRLIALRNAFQALPGRQSSTPRLVTPRTRHASWTGRFTFGFDRRFDSTQGGWQFFTTGNVEDSDERRAHERLGNHPDHFPNNPRPNAAQVELLRRHIRNNGRNWAQGNPTANIEVVWVPHHPAVRLAQAGTSENRSTTAQNQTGNDQPSTSSSNPAATNRHPTNNAATGTNTVQQSIEQEEQTNLNNNGDVLQRGAQPQPSTQPPLASHDESSSDKPVKATSGEKSNVQQNGKVKKGSKAPQTANAQAQSTSSSAPQPSVNLQRAPMPKEKLPYGQAWEWHDDWGDWHKVIVPTEGFRDSQQDNIDQARRDALMNPNANTRPPRRAASLKPTDSQGPAKQTREGSRQESVSSTTGKRERKGAKKGLVTLLEDSDEELPTKTPGGKKRRKRTRGPQDIVEKLRRDKRGRDGDDDGTGGMGGAVEVRHAQVPTMTDIYHPPTEEPDELTKPDIQRCPSDFAPSHKTRSKKTAKTLSPAAIARKKPSLEVQEFVKAGMLAKRNSTLEAQEAESDDEDETPVEPDSTSTDLRYPNSADGPSFKKRKTTSTSSAAAPGSTQDRPIDVFDGRRSSDELSTHDDAEFDDLGWDEEGQRQALADEEEQKRKMDAEESDGTGKERNKKKRKWEGNDDAGKMAKKGRKGDEDEDEDEGEASAGKPKRRLKIFNNKRSGDFALYSD